MLLNKPRSRVEIIGDLNADLIHMWRVIRDGPYMIRPILERTPYSLESFNLAAQQMTSQLPWERAVGFLVQNRMSRGGLGKTFAWSERLRGGQPGDVNGWETFVRDHLPRVVDRLQGVSILDWFAIDTMRAMMDEYDNNENRILIYCDPPYLHETRTAKDAYQFEMSRLDHRNLIDEITDLSCRGAKVFLSGYWSALYDNLVGTHDWTMHEFPTVNHSGQGKVKQARIECLWESPDR